MCSKAEQFQTFKTSAPDLWFCCKMQLYSIIEHKIPDELTSFHTAFTIFDYRTKPTASMEQRLTIVTLGVSDLAASEKFYSGVLGWKKTEASNENIAFYQLNGILLSLYPAEKLAEDARISPEGTGFRKFSIAWNARSEREVDEIIDQLKEKGVEIVKTPEKVFWGGYSGYIADPDGNLWEIAYNPYLPLDNNGNVV